MEPTEDCCAACSLVLLGWTTILGLREGSHACAWDKDGGKVRLKNNSVFMKKTGFVR